MPPYQLMPYHCAECVPNDSEPLSRMRRFAQVSMPEKVLTAPPSQGGSARFKSLGPVNRAPKPIQADGVKS
jgi:hypothetical protein